MKRSLKRLAKEEAKEREKLGLPKLDFVKVYSSMSPDQQKCLFNSLFPDNKGNPDPNAKGGENPV